jgi:two-component system sensor histidine kinase SenX3
MKTTLPLLPVALGAVVVVALFVFVWTRSRARNKALCRRMASLAGRLEGAAAYGAIEDTHNVESALTRLERTVDSQSSATTDRDADQFRVVGALQRLDEGVVVADEAGNLVFANPSARRWLGGRHIDAVVDHRIRSMLRSVIERNVESEDDLDLIGPPRTFLRLCAYPLAGDTRPLGGVLFVQDVTETRRVDEVRRDFVANISHELKTPVGALGLLAETLSDTLDEPEVADRLASRIAHEAGRLVRIIDDLLALTRLEAEESARRERISVDLIVAEAVERVRAGYVDTELQILTDVDPDAFLAGDRRQLTSAVYNLVENAVKYSEPGSPIVVTARDDGDDCEISVQDRGVGIPASDRARIFERFYRVDRARSRATGGTGLGLAIVRHVVNNHGGTVDVTSELGSGSTFTITVPAAERDVVVPRAALPQESAAADAEAAATKAGRVTETGDDADP